VHSSAAAAVCGVCLLWHSRAVSCWCYCCCCCCCYCQVIHRDLKLENVLLNILEGSNSEWL
jgi:serine/threonine protein kinase